MKVCCDCVLDETVDQLVFDQAGRCSYCLDYDAIRPGLEEKLRDGEEFLATIKTRLGREARGSYDAILGISGGVDSSYVALLAKRLGLNPLLVHFDNGWNSETAVSNIKKISTSCDFDLETYVINWKEFRDLQRAFFKASVLDIEMITDHAIMAVLYQLSRKHKTRNVLSGNNLATEFGMPPVWSYNKRDFTNIRAIHKRFGEVPLKTFPVLTTWKWLLISKLGVGMNFIEVLNYLPYKKSQALEELEREFDWQYYGGKHYESTFTRFYQAYVLPEKFGIDKRKAHFSSLIRNGELTREQALAQLELPLYAPGELARDIDYVTKKLGFSSAEFEQIMASPPRPHNSYPSDEFLFRKLQGVYRFMRPGRGQG